MSITIMRIFIMYAALALCVAANLTSRKWEQPLGTNSKETELGETDPAKSGASEDMVNMTKSMNQMFENELSEEIEPALQQLEKSGMHGTRTAARIRTLTHDISVIDADLDILEVNLTQAMDEDNKAFQDELLIQVKELMTKRIQLHQIRQSALMLLQQIEEGIKKMTGKWNHKVDDDDNDDDDDDIENIVQKNNINTYSSGVKKRVKRAACLPILPNTNYFVDSQMTLKNKAIDNRICIEKVRTNAEQLKKTISDFHKATELLKELDANMSLTVMVLTPLTLLPQPIGASLSASKLYISGLQTTIQTPLDNMKRVDQKLYPTFYKRLGEVITVCEQCEEHMENVKMKAISYYSYMDPVRNCMCANPDNAVSMDSEEFTGNMREPIDITLSAFGSVGNTCDTYDTFITVLKDTLKVNIINNIISKLRNLVDLFNPLSEMYDLINIAFDERLCIPDPVEVGKEVIKIEVSKEVIEDANEVLENKKEAVKRQAKRKIKRFWRGKRNVFLNKKEAASFLDIHSRVKRTSNICFTIRKIFDGISAAFDALIQMAKDYLLDILKNFVDLDTFPGLPNFNLDFPKLLLLNWPVINLDMLDLNFDISSFLEIQIPQLPCPV